MSAQKLPEWIKKILLTSAIPLILAIGGWAYRMSMRVSAMEARQEIMINMIRSIAGETHEKTNSYRCSVSDARRVSEEN